MGSNYPCLFTKGYLVWYLGFETDLNPWIVKEWSYGYEEHVPPEIVQVTPSRSLSSCLNNLFAEVPVFFLVVSGGICLRILFK